MKDPIKIIHKFKNNNRKIQYHVYIYIGSILPDEIMKILENIVDKDFYTTLNTISKNNYNILEKYYGKYWYQYFFISYHINNQKIQIDTNKFKKTQLETKYGKEWYNDHIKITNLIKKTYSYAYIFYENLLLKNKIKIKTKTKKLEIDFRTYNAQKGGDNENVDDEDDDEDEDKDENENENEDKNLINFNDELNKEEFDEQIEEYFNLDELSKLYANNDIENNKSIKETSQLISEAINDNKWQEKLTDIDIKYDNSYDNLAYDVKLEDIYNKYYIKNQYIFKDDTIKNLKNKISVSIPISNKFGENIKILPETQYFWSEYLLENDTLDYVMLGQKWIRKNELLKIDIKPNENLKIYEKLRNNLSYLKDNIGYKIKRDNDETNIIRFYEDFMTMNEIFMLDIYNELGLNYNSTIEEKKNLYDVYVNIYYPMITFDRLEQIILLLNGKNTNELLLIESQFTTLKIDNKLETEIEQIVETSKIKLIEEKYDKLFLPNYIIQSIIHINIQDPKNITGVINNTKINLYRIFDNFIVNEKYPFIQYQTLDSQITYKFYNPQNKLNDLNNEEILSKWFENSPYGISFKIKMNLKYISINLHESGRIEYKITWKEEDKATIENIIETYNYVKDLLKKINSENKKIKFIIPSDDKFKYAFINTIQKFKLPDKIKINHNDLSEFSRFFFPYISLVIEPKKRQSKKTNINDDISKYGTYLRYKRISKYDNRTKMHLRLLYFLRNYNLTDKELIDEISKQFNITLDVSAKELDFVREKYSKIIKKTFKKVLKTSKVLPKSKPPGIGIDIQGRDQDNYKIRITGARNKEQLDEIIIFMKVLIYLYVETYINKKTEYQKLKNTLKTLTKIAKRRNKVHEIVEYESPIKNVKIMTSLDKDRLGFRPEKGQNQWTRSCQNSGTNKKRRPEIIQDNNIDKLIKNGYKLNKKTNFYEKIVELKIKGKKYNTKLQAIKLPDKQNTFNYYTCDPSENNEFMYIGFLTKSNNPNDLCMPCCFKKNPIDTVNVNKKNYFLKCLGQEYNNKEENINKSLDLGDKVYILQETNKIQEGRFIYLPKYLDIFFNKIWNNDHKIINHYLYESKSGYFFKYTVKDNNYYFLVAIAAIYNLTIKDIIKNLVLFLENDKNNRYFTYLNNGDIAEMFKDKKKFINFINTSYYLEYDIIGELCALPNVISDNGIIYFIINKKKHVIKKALEKEEIKEKYYMDCLNIENYYQFNYNYDIIILIKDENYYFPIYKIKKNIKEDKKILLQKIYNTINDNDLIKELLNYHNKSCQNKILNNIININDNLIAKNIIEKIKNKYKILNQYIDDRHKCKYLELNNNLLIPVIPSGISYEYKFTYLKNNNILNLLSFNKTLELLKDLESFLNLNYKPKSVFYDKKDNDKINIISILLQNNLIIPIKNEYINQKNIKQEGLFVVFQSLEENINEAILNYSNEIIYDDRLKRVKEHNYYNEGYNIYRLELSLYLNNNDDIKQKIISIVRNKNLKVEDKKHELKNIFLSLIDKKLNNDIKLSNNNMIFIVNNIPDLKKYIIHNVRNYCEINNDKDKCNSNLHCLWKNNTCKLQLTEQNIYDYINKLLEECINDDIKFKELIQESDYYVSDIVNNTQYTFRENQKIIKSSNFNINKLMSELFGKNNIPIIGKRQLNKINNEIVEENYPELIEIGKQLIQEIVSNKDSIIRAYINCYYWINNPLYDIESRNLNYISELQTNLTYIFKANIIDFIQNNNNEEINKYLEKYFKKKNNINFFDSTINKFRKTTYNTDGLIELFILSHLILLPIVVYDNYSNIKYIFLQGKIKVNDDTIKKFTENNKLNKTIFLKFNYDNDSNIPHKIYSIYYI
jgi:hypothetical protein